MSPPFRRTAALVAPTLLVLSSCASGFVAPREPERQSAPSAAPSVASTAPPKDAVDADDDEGGWEGWREAEEDGPDDVVGLPGEYEPVERVLFGWHPGNWDYVRFFASVLRSVTADARALIAVESPDEQIMLMESLASHGVDLSRVDFVIHMLDSMWIRDYGPMIVRTRDGGYRVIDLPYHVDREHDDRYPATFARREGLPVSRPPLEMEGGHIQSDGAGRCVITDDVLARNEVYEYTEDDVRRLLRRYFGCRQVTIVPALFAEETGHVDVFAYVTGPAHIIVGAYRSEDDLVNSRRLNRAARALREAGFTVTRIPMPSNDHRRVFRTHTNVLVTNHHVLVPVFRRDRHHQHEALRAFARAFPNRRVVGIAADGVISLAGAVHCTAMSVPALRPPARVARHRARRRRRRRG